MAQYHLKDNGDPARCTATKGACPKGGAHFDSEEEAWAAVEKLFGNSFKAAPEPLAVYTKTAVRGQFSSLFDVKTGRSHMYWDDGPFEAYAHEHVREVYELLTESRLDVKSQNLKVREVLEGKVASLQAMRTGKEEQAKIEAAVSLSYLAPILQEHYGVPDPRTEAQQQADEAFAQEYNNEKTVLPYSGQYPIVDVTAYTDEDLDRLIELGSKEPKSLSDEELREMFDLNKQAQGSSSRYDFTNEPMNAWDYYRALQDRKAKSETVPDDMQQYLLNEMRKDKIEENLAAARREILTLAPLNSWGHRESTRSKPLAKVASDLKELRKRNEEVKRAVLEA